jgi:NitT/TauT family transport system substrate-binding protein
VGVTSRRRFLGAFVALSPLAAYARAVRAQGAPAPALAPILVTTTTPIDVVPFFYGMGQKLFERAGLDVTFQTIGSGAQAMIAVIGGAANIGFGNPLTIVTAYAKGAPVQFVAPGSDFVLAAPTSQIFVLPDSPIRVAKDLEDHAVAVTGLHDLMAIAVRAWADDAGADSSKIRFIEIPPSSTIAALQAKRVDAAGLFEPLRAEASGLGMRAIGAPYASISKEFITGAWFGNSTWIAGHRDAALRFAEVIRAAGDYANAHYAALIPLIASFSKMAPETIGRTNRPHFPAAVTPAAIQPLVNVAAKYKEIPTAFRAQDAILSARG